MTTLAPPGRLTVEHVADAVATVGVRRPRLGWTPPPGSPATTAYQVAVATHPDLARSGTPDVWDSGRRTDPAAVATTYTGPGLRSDRRYHWVVRVWAGERVSAWSEPAAFHTGLFDADDWHAQWIGGTAATRRTGDEPNAEPLLRRTFGVRAGLTSARLYLSAAGYVRVWLGGHQVGDGVLEPGFTNLDERVLYVLHDVTDLVRPGENVAAAALGRGFRGLTTKSVWEWSEAPWHGEPALLFQLHLEYADGSRERVVSDPSWRTHEGPTRFDSLYAGETFDARRDLPGWREAGFDDASWESAVPAPDRPRGVLTAQTAEPIRRREDLPAAAIHRLGAGAHVVDFGRTLAGWATLRPRAAAGTTVDLRYGEKLRADGSVDNDNELAARRSQTDEYVAAGRDDEAWTPSYSWKGFRYVEVRGLDAVGPETLTAHQVASDVSDAGSFDSDEPMYVWLERAMRATVRNNLHSVPTDTPFFEKNGWTGDAHVALWSLLYQFDLSRFLAKWLEDFRDEQLDSGSFPIFVPSAPTFRAAAHLSPAWTGVYPSLLAAYHLAYDDVERLRSHWEPLTRYLAFVASTLVDGLPEDAHGDWLAPADDGNPIPPEDRRLAGTAYSYRSLRTGAGIADLLGHDDDARRWRAVAADARRRFEDTFFDAASGHYVAGAAAGYRQTSNLLPVALGLAGPDHAAAAVRSVVADVQARGDHLNTGCLGTSVLLPVLTEHGHGEVAHRLVRQDTYPSWGYWRARDADTLWEAWGDDARSRDHYFLGSPVEWLYAHVAGVRPTAPGYRRFSVRPHLLGDVGAASAVLDTVRGRAAVSWRRDDRTVEIDVEIPGGAQAEVSLPAPGHDAVVAGPAGIADWSTSGGRVTATVNSGVHRFVVRPTP